MNSAASEFPAKLAGIDHFILLQRKIVTTEFNNIPLPTPKVEQNAPVTAASEADAPKLRFLAWQDDSTKGGPGGWRAWHPDGTPVTDPEELKQMDGLREQSLTMSAFKNPHFLCIWISHPGLTKNSLNPVTLSGWDKQQRPLLYAGGSESVHEGWVTCAFNMTYPDDLPATLDINLVCSVDPWKTLAENIPPVSNTYVPLKDVTLGAIGETSEGHALVNLVRQGSQVTDTQYDFQAITKDKRVMNHSISTFTTGVHNVNIEASEFPLKLAEVDHFVLRSRPIKTMVFKNVPLLSTEEKTAATALSQAPAPAPPEFVCVAWLDEIESDSQWRAWAPQGNLLNRKDLLLPDSIVSISKENLAKIDTSSGIPRYACLWFRDPGLDAESLIDIKLLDDSGKPLTDPADPAAMNNGTGVIPPCAQNHGMGWITATLYAGRKGSIPGIVSARLRYSTGPWQYWNDIAPGFSGSMALDSGVHVTQSGQGEDGRAFVELTRDPSKDTNTMQIDFIAKTKDGRTLTRNMTSATWDDKGIKIERFIFDAPLTQVTVFQSRKRPINGFTSNLALAHGEKMPSQPGADAAKASEPVMISITADGSFHIGDEKFDLAAMKVRLKEIAGEGIPSLPSSSKRIA